MLFNLSQLIKKYDMQITGVVHIGANLGQELESYRDNNIKNIILIEPLIEVFNQLLEKTSNYSDLNITLFNVALGNESGQAIMNVSNYNGMSSSLLEPELHLELHPDVTFDTQETVRIERLDNLIYGRSSYNMINIDVQGFELEVFKGATESLSTIKYINAEVSKEYVYSKNGLIGELDQFLSTYNFERVETQWAGGWLPWGDAFYIKKENTK